jgi:hypothetical protein
LKIRICGGPNPKDIKVIDEETGSSIPNIMSIQYDASVEGVYVTIKFIPNSIDVVVDEPIFINMKNDIPF